MDLVPRRIGTGRPVWDDITPDEDLAALRPGRPSELARKPDVCVIGGGQIGLATAMMCRRAGLGSVLVIEREERLASGPSGRNGGFLIPVEGRGFGDAWFTFARRAFDLHRALDAEWGVGMRVIDLLVVPDLVVADQGHTNPLRVAAAYARAGGVCATGVEVKSVVTDGGRIVRIVTDAGTIEPGAVVFATGALPEVCGDVRQGSVKGHVLVTEPVPFELERMINVEELGIVQLPDRRLLIGGTKDFGDDSLELAGASVERLSTRLVEVLPAAAGAEPSHLWTCFRPHLDDDLLVVDAVPGASNAWTIGALYSFGLLLAPAVGEAVAAWIGSGERPEGLDAFSLRRPALAAG